ncbi:hypothetical protein XENOCAPTIV_029164 [Xenoophorus captivus]|uniref:Uncharacterized protein n=1 Tax=Xenoophorus captivus TaxID=1517983 RepID=A0ABV0QNK2_9TELE
MERMTSKLTACIKQGRNDTPIRYMFRTSFRFSVWHMHSLHSRPFNLLICRLTCNFLHIFLQLIGFQVLHSLHGHPTGLSCHILCVLHYLLFCCVSFDLPCCRHLCLLYWEKHTLGQKVLVDHPLSITVFWPHHIHRYVWLPFHHNVWLRLPLVTKFLPSLHMADFD